ATPRAPGSTLFPYTTLFRSLGRPDTEPDGKPQDIGHAPMVLARGTGGETYQSRAGQTPGKRLQIGNGLGRRDTGEKANTPRVKDTVASQQAPQTEEWCNQPADN